MTTTPVGSFVLRALRSVVAVGALVAWGSAAGVAVACPSTPPPPSVTTNLCNGILVSWPTLPSATGYDVIRTTGATTVTVASNIGSTFLLDTSALVGVSYTYQVRGRSTNPFTCPSGFGPTGPSSSAGVRIGVPTLPTISPTNTSCQFTLFIGAPEFTTAVEVYRATTMNLGDAVLVLTSNLSGPIGTSVLDPTPAVFGVTYYYWARSLGTCGSSAYTGPVPATLSIGVPTAVPAPSAEPGTECGAIRFSWNAVPGSIFYDYIITPPGPGSTGSTAGTEVVYIATDGLPRTISVRAHGGCGSTAYSAGVSGFANAAPSAAIGSVPGSVAVDPGEDAVISLNLIAIPSLIGARWHKDGTPMTDSARITGATTGTLTIMDASGSDAGEYRLEVETACGVGQSATAVLGVRASCPGDVDGSGTVDLLDLLSFISEWSANLGQNCP